MGTVIVAGRARADKAGAHAKTQTTNNPSAGSSATKTGSPLVRARADKQARARQFASVVAPLVAAAGGASVVALGAGVCPGTVHQWCTGRAVPYVRTIVTLSTVLGVEPNVLLAAAGKPPLASVRERIANSPDSSLPMILCQVRTECFGGSTAAAAEHLAMSRHQFSRLANGSRVVSNVGELHRLAAGLGMDERDVMEASGLATARLSMDHKAMTSGFAGKLRQVMATAGLDSWDSAGVTKLAHLAHRSPGQLNQWLSGRAVPDVISCQLLAKGLRRASGTADPGAKAEAVILTSLLAATGMSPELAAKFAAARAAIKPGRAYGDLAQLVRAYRLVADLTKAELSSRLGLAHHAPVTRWEQGTAQPTLNMLISLSEILHAPLPRLLAVSEHVA